MQQVSNSYTGNQQISTLAHSLGHKSKITLGSELLVQNNQRVFMGSKSHYQEASGAARVQYRVAKMHRMP